MRFFSDISRNRAPSSTWRYQSWPTRHTKPAATMSVMASTRRLHASRRVPGAALISTRSSPRHARTRRLGKAHRHETRRPEGAVVERLGNDHVHHQRRETGGIVEELEQPEAEGPPP